MYRHILIDGFSFFRGGGRGLTSDMVTTAVLVYVLLATGAGLRGFLHVLLGELIALSLLASASVIFLACLTAVPWDIVANT